MECKELVKDKDLSSKDQGEFELVIVLNYNRQYKDVKKIIQKH